jgi:predicted secreted protein
LDVGTFLPSTQAVESAFLLAKNTTARTPESLTLITDSLVWNMPIRRSFRHQPLREQRGYRTNPAWVQECNARRQRAMRWHETPTVALEIHETPQRRYTRVFGYRINPMRICMKRISPLLMGAVCTAALAQSPTAATGTLVTVPATSEVRQANDEQDKDKAQAASRVNLKMKQGIELVHREDPQAVLKSHGYYTYPVYSDEPLPKNQRTRQIVSWRVGQYLDVTTTNLPALPKVVASTQRTLAVNGLNFGLSDTAARRLDDKRIAVTYQNLSERIASIARAMGRKAAEASIENIDFDGASSEAQALVSSLAKMTMRGAAAEPTVIEEPSFEPGETALTMRVVAKVRFK